MKRWMTSLAPNRRTKFVSFTSRLLGKCPRGGGGRLQGGAGRCRAGALQGRGGGSLRSDRVVPTSRRPTGHMASPARGALNQPGWTTSV